MKKIVILFTTRNNYAMLDNWLKSFDYEGFSVLNIDENSNEEEKQKGRKIKDKYKITHLEDTKRGMLNNIKTACEFFSKKNCEWVFVPHHDCWPLTPNFFSKFNKLANTNKIKNFGLVGFNTLHKCNIQKSYAAKELNYLARAPLEPGDNWYRNKKYWGGTRVDLKSGKFDKPFAVENPAAFGVMVNINLYNKVIEPIDDYHMMHSWDEIGFQFMYNNIYNLSIPYLHLGHDPTLKTRLGIPAVSVKAHKSYSHFIQKRFTPKEYNKNLMESDSKYFGKMGNHVLFNRWGINYDKARKSYELVKDKYKETLLDVYYNHDPINGPLKSFPDIIYDEDR